MANDVLSVEDLEFIAVNAEQIKQFADEKFGGNLSMESRQRYEEITLKLGRRFNICWTCSASMKRIGKQLSQWL